MAKWLSSNLSASGLLDEPEIHDAAVSDEQPQSSEVSAFTQARRRRLDSLDRIEAKIEELVSERDNLRREVAALDSLLGNDSTLPTPSVVAVETIIQRRTSDAGEPGPSIGHQVRSRSSPSLAESVDATVKVLCQSERPLHYRDIHAKVVAMGIYVPGKDPAATLLSRFSRDPRVERAGSGTYHLAQHASPNIAQYD